MEEMSTAPSGGANASSLWGGLLAFGIITALFGVAIMAWPDLTIGVLVVLLGIQLILAGIFDVVGAFASEAKGGMKWAAIIVGVIALGLGVLVLFNGDGLGDSLTNTVQVLGIILGIFWLIHGVVDAISGFTDSEAPHRMWRILGGIVSAVAGIIVIAWPGKSLLLFTWLMGLFLLALGLITILAAFAVRREAKKA